MKEITLEELREIQVRMLKNLHKFCQKHDLLYVLAFGTLLGAIRHNGYIPWDDDIDIMMPRKDYERFCKELNVDGMRIVTSDNTPGYTNPFAKVIDTNTVLYEETTSKCPMGVYIDLFPMDYLPKDSQEKKRRYRKAEILNNILLCKNVTFKYKTDFKHKLYHLAVKLLSVFMSKKAIIDRIDSLRKIDEASQSNNIGCYLLRRSYKWELPYTTYFSTCPHAFEDETFNIPTQYDVCLTKVYGDYMKLPPEDQRVSNHLFRAYYLEK